MKYLVLFILLFLATPEYVSAVVSVSGENSQGQVLSQKPEKQIIKKYTFKKLISKIRSAFEFDLSDPVDGWLSLAILLFAGAIVCGLINWLIGGLYLLGLLTTIFAVLGLGSFVVWIIKTVG